MIKLYWVPVFQDRKRERDRHGATIERLLYTLWIRDGKSKGFDSQAGLFFFEEVRQMLDREQRLFHCKTKITPLWQMEF